MVEGDDSGVGQEMNVAWLREVPLRGRLRFNEPMARHCTWRAGGVVERFFEPLDLADLAAYLRAAPRDEPLTWVGFGSNLLVRDGGLRGTVIATATALGKLIWRDEHSAYAGAGVACAKVARQAATRQLGGGEFLAGIPGTIGGALAMNAGAFGHEIWELVESVETLGRDGVLKTRAASEFRAAYRHLDGLQDEWFAAGVLKLGKNGGAGAKVKALLQARSASQPLGLPSCGSVFKNPPGDFAGRLIEAAGAKGAVRGGAYVSPKHANFIINDGTATAADIEGLMLDVQAAVRAHAGVSLESEVRILGDFAASEVHP